VDDAGPALQRSRRLETAVLTVRERESAIECLRDGVQRRA